MRPVIQLQYIKDVSDYYSYIRKINLSSSSFHSIECSLCACEKNSALLAAVSPAVAKIMHFLWSPFWGSPVTTQESSMRDTATQLHTEGSITTLSLYSPHS